MYDRISRFSGLIDKNYSGYIFLKNLLEVVVKTLLSRHTLLASGGVRSLFLGSKTLLYHPVVVLGLDILEERRACPVNSEGLLLRFGLRRHNYF